MHIFNYRVKQWEHYADHSYKAVISPVVMLLLSMYYARAAVPREGQTVWHTRQDNSVLYQNVSEFQQFHLDSEI